MEEQEQYEGHFNAFVGEFAARVNIEKRQKAERLAAMKPGDGRRKRISTKEPKKQLNVQATLETKGFVDALCKTLSARDGRKWSQADVIEAAIGQFAISEKIGAST